MIVDAAVVAPRGEGAGVPPSRTGSGAQVLAARELTPGALVWPNGEAGVRVLAVLPGADVVTVITTERDGLLGCFTCAGEDGYRTCGAVDGHDCSKRARDFVLYWHQKRGMLCCPDEGPYCCASVAYAFEQLRQGESSSCGQGRRP